MPNLFEHCWAEAYLRLKVKVVQGERSAKQNSFFVCNPEPQPIFAEGKVVQGEYNAKFIWDDIVVDPVVFSMRITRILRILLLAKFASFVKLAFAPQGPSNFLKKLLHNSSFVTTFAPRNEPRLTKALRMNIFVY